MFFPDANLYGGVYFVSVDYDSTTEGTRARIVNFLVNFERSAFTAFKMRKFQTAVYPPRMAPIGAKLWENAFQTICNISFFDVGKKIGDFFCAKFWWFELQWHVRRQKSLPEVGLFSLYDPWRRGKRLNLCFGRWLRAKNDLYHVVVWCHDIMILRYYEFMIIWYNDNKKVYLNCPGVTCVLLSVTKQNRHGHMYMPHTSDSSAPLGYHETAWGSIGR